ncbi:MAG TPA: hypothetical protein VF774_15980 [Pseudoduganella sp.]
MTTPANNIEVKEVLRARPADASRLLRTTTLAKARLAFARGPPPGLSRIFRHFIIVVAYLGVYMRTMHIAAAGQIPRPRSVSRRMPVLGAILAILSAFLVGPSLAVDLEAFTGIAGPLTSALTQLSTLTPGLKGIVGFISFCVAFISLAGLRNLGPVLFYIGVMIFGAVGLLIGGAIMGAVI